MKYFGDISEEHRELVKELEALEKWFNEHGNDLPAGAIAKGMTCIAHDYFCMEMEETGERFLKEAEKHCPGYFKGPIFVHIDKDSDFRHLIKQLKKTLGYETMVSLGFEE
jgi:hypothetical protein